MQAQRVGEGAFVFESFELLAADAECRRLLLELAALRRTGQLCRFVELLCSDPDLDAETKAAVIEIASDQEFLLAVEDYLYRTVQLH